MYLQQADILSNELNIDSFVLFSCVLILSRPHIPRNLLILQVLEGRRLPLVHTMVLTTKRETHYGFGISAEALIPRLGHLF